MASRLDTFSDQTMIEVPQIKTENIKKEPKSPLIVIQMTQQIQ